jgi:hypothetical protein
MDKQSRGIGHGYELESRGQEDHVCHHAANLVDVQVSRPRCTGRSIIASQALQMHVR